MRLQNKLILSFLICILVVFIPAVTIAETRLRPASEQQILIQTEQLVTSKAAEVGSWLNQRISEIRIIHNYPGISTLDYDRIKPYLTSLNEIVRQQYGNPEEAFAIGGTDGQGWINDTLTIDVHQRPYFIEAMNTEKEYVISNPVISKSDDKPIFLICYPVRNENHETVGFINGSINLTKFTDILSSASLYDGFSWIMNKNGRTYTSEDQVFTEKGLSENELQEIIANAGTSGYLKLSGSPDETIFYAEVPYAEDWLYCVQIRDANLFSSFDSMMRMLVKFALFLLALSAGLAVWLSRSITAPIEKLKSSMQDVSEGNLNTVYQSNSNDEIAMLGSSFNTMICRLKELIGQVIHVQQQRRRAEIRALQAQINPHFLYNTLDTIQWKALEYNATEVSDMIYQLAKMFRISVSDGREFIPVMAEIQHVESYLKLQKMRLQDFFHYEIDVQPETEEMLIPKLILQPLVENSLTHGLDRKKKDGLITIRVTSEQDRIILSVQDNGIGISAGHMEQLLDDLKNHKESDHYGLYNIHERLYLTYRDRYELKMESPEGKGLKITLSFPVEEEEESC